MIFTLRAFLWSSLIFYQSFLYSLNVYASEDKDMSFIPPVALSNGSVTYVLKSRHFDNDELTADISLNFPELVDCESSDINEECMKFTPKFELPFHPEDSTGLRQPTNNILKFKYNFYEKKFLKILSKSHDILRVGEASMSLYYDVGRYKIDRRARRDSLMLNKSIYHSYEARCRLGRRITDDLYELRNMNRSEFSIYEEKTNVNILPYCFGVPDSIYPQFSVDGKVKTKPFYGVNVVLFNKEDVSSVVGVCTSIVKYKKQYQNCRLNAFLNNKIRSKTKILLNNISEVKDIYYEMVNLVAMSSSSKTIGGK